MTITDTDVAIQVLDHGFVRLDAHMADDLSVVNAARVSLHNRHEVMEEGDDKLINALMRNHHGTPFEHNSFRFHVKAPIFVFREWHRHRIASINEWSARYSKLEPCFYIPKGENVRSQVGKAMSYEFEPVDSHVSGTFSADLLIHCNKSFGLYEKMMDRGVAKEQARLFLPVNIYSEMYWTVNARSLMNFLNLRNAPSAMFEIREYARVLEDIFSILMPDTWKAFVDNERVAP
jgi:thymidylate synthase (FAD)